MLPDDIMFYLEKPDLDLIASLRIIECRYYGDRFVCFRKGRTRGWGGAHGPQRQVPR
jgi:hypothetical protein